MAFDDLMRSLELPKSVSERYRKLEALGLMLDGKLYKDMRYSFETEAESGRKHIPLRERRPSVVFNLAYEVTQDTFAELFGDEQFPIIKAMVNREEDDAATTEIRALVDLVALEDAITETYEEGVLGSVAVVLHTADNGLPYYEVLPGKYCQPIYRSHYSNELVGLIVTYPLTAKAVEERITSISKEERERGGDVWWYRYAVGPGYFVDYVPMPEERYRQLGEKDERDNTIEFVEYERRAHGFDGRVPAVYLRNFGGRGREPDGMALWWPVVDICVDIDYTLSQASRGLRYSADPTIFVRRVEADISEGLYEKPMGGMASVISDGSPVRGVTQTLVGRGEHDDAKILEINASGMKEEREFVADLREYALEVLGGVRARAHDRTGPITGRAIDKTLKPLRRLVRRQRRPYGRGLTDIIDLTVYGFRAGAFTSDDFDLAKVAEKTRYLPDWPNDETLQGQDLLQHVEGLQLLAGGSQAAPKELITPDAVGAKAAADVGFHETYESIKGSGKPAVVPGASPAGGSPPK